MTTSRTLSHRVLSCHHDILPTIIGLANGNISEDYLGVNLEPLINNTTEENYYFSREIEFETLDEVTKGNNQTAAFLTLTPIIG